MRFGGSLALALAASVAAAPAGAASAGRSLGQPILDVPARDMLLTEARIHLARRRIPEAIYSLTRALHEHPDNLDIAYKLADLHYQRREYDKAIALLKAYLDRSTSKRNLYYPLGLSLHKTGRLRDALGAYARAVQIDPTHKKAYVRMAQVRIRQGLPFDAQETLRKVLQLDPQYLPALEEMKIAQKLATSTPQSVFRKRNMVILFHDPKELPMVERAYPFLEAARRKLEDDLKYHIPIVWVKLENVIRRFHHPPAMYDAPEDSLLVELATLEKADYAPIIHQMARMYLEKMGHGRVPQWFAEGIALHYAEPAFLRCVALRTVDPLNIKIPRDEYVQRTYLRFDQNPELLKRYLAQAFVVARYFLEHYGVVGLRKLLLTLREGGVDFWEAAWKVLHLEKSVFLRRFEVYAIRGHYFAEVTQPQAP